MRVLIVNDDGIDAVGIRTLAKRFEAKHEVMVVAPMNQRSGFSHSLTIDADILFERREYSYPAYAISGTPADCTKTGILYFNEGDDFDLVLSGINNGANLGTDILYSGTVAAATEGAMHGVASLAISLEKWNCPDSAYERAADFIYDNIDGFIKLCRAFGGVLNVNYPIKAPFKGVRLTKSGINLYNDSYAAGATDGSVRIYGQPTPHNLNDEDCDVELIKKGYVTVTPLTPDRNDSNALIKLKDMKIF